MNLHYRTALALAVTLAIFLSSLGLTVSVQAQTSSGSTGNEYDHFLIYQAADGDTICREANALERRELDQIAPKNLRQFNHLDTDLRAMSIMSTQTDSAVGRLTIILRATANLDANPAAKAAFIRAASAWEAVVTSPVTIYLDADYGPDNFGTAWGSGTLGATSSPSSTVGYSTVRNNLINGANTAAKQAVYQSLPTNSIPVDTGSGSSSSVSVSASIGRAIGLLNPTAQPTDTAARIGFNSSFTFDFDPSDGISSGQTDFEAVATHEIGHALGFTSRSGSGSSTPAMWDVYRFRSGTTTSTFATAPRIMTIGGPTTNSQYYFVPGASEIGLSDGGPSGSTDNNADGNQSSHWRQASRNGGVFAGYIGIMDPRIPSGIRRQITQNDTRALEIFGYNSNIPPPAPAPANDNFSAAQTVTGCAGTTTGTNVSATRESGEPNHSPDNNGGSRSVWYTWQAPASGQAQITTAGSNFDTVLAVYTGSAVNSLTPVAPKNDDAVPGSDLTSSVSFNAVAGTTYRIAVDGYNNDGSGGDVGAVTLNWSLSGCGSSWLPTALNPSQIELKSWTINGMTSIYVKLHFPDAGYRVANWGAPVQSGSNFFVDAVVEKFNGVSAQVLTNTAQIYDLGAIAAGNYTFNFRNMGTTVKSLNFTVSFLPPPANPIDDAREFVRWQYRDFLRREPDAPGLDHWTNQITMCSNSANRLPGESEPDCVSRKRASTSAAFFLSPEFQNMGYFVLRVYLGSLGRMPKFGGTTGSGSEFTRDASTVSNGIVVNNQLSPSVINANKQAFVNEFVTRPEFRAIYDGLSNAQYVDRLFQTTGIPPTADERNALIAEAETAGGRASVLFKVIDGTNTVTDGHLVFNTRYGKAFYDARFNAAFVQMEYFGYLQRDPDDNGFSFWLNKMSLFGNWVDAQMVLAFITSPEYRARFGAP